MVRRGLWLTVLAALFSAFLLPAHAQVCAPQLQSSLVCVIPQVYGATGLTLPNPAHQAHFEGDFENIVLPVTVSVGTELALRSIASPASGVLFTFDKALGTVTQSTESYGPILTERAETVGRHRIFVAATYEYRGFSSLDGISLKHLPLTLTHVQFQDTSLPASDTTPCPQYGTCPIYAEDFISTQNRIDLKAHEITFYATYGLTSRIDLSVAIPVLDVRLGITSNAHINREAPQPVDPIADPLLYATTNNGYYHYFRQADPAGSLDASFFNRHSAAGIGDVVFRAKGTIWRGQHIRAALGMDVRTPTGDERNFLGSGAVGVKGFLAASYAARISPHVNLGFEYNGDSILAGSVQTNAEGKLPNEFFYSVGADARLTKRLTVAADMLGTRLSSTQRVRVIPYVDPIGAAPPGVAYPGISQVESYKDSLNMVDISVGAKYKAIGNLLVTGNVVFKANDGGLRARVVPLGSVSYTF